MFKETDTDASGMLDYAEFCNVMKENKKEYDGEDSDVDEN